jgi:3-oxoacyl-[acyl-carrier-protein] synthase II
MVVGERIAVVGAGVKTPVGNDLDTIWSLLRSGHASAAPWNDARLPADADVLACTVTDFDARAYVSAPEERRLDRAHHLAIGAAQDAMDAVGTDLPAPERRAVVCGVGFGATTTYEAQHERLLTHGLRGLSPLVIPIVMPSSVAAHLSLRFECRGPTVTVSTACASGANAIGEAVEMLRRGRADVVIAGGVDAMVTYNALCSFLRLDVMSRCVASPELASRPFDIDRDGFVMGEGAGFVVLEREPDARAQGRSILGYVAGYGTNADAHHLVAPSVGGEGALRCMRLALDDAGLSPADIGHVNAHGTATQANDVAEARALLALFGPTTPPVTAVKGATGHMIGGSGAVEAIVSLLSIRHGEIPPVAGLRHLDPEITIDAVTGAPRALPASPVLSNSFGFGGANAVLVLSPA